MTQYFPENSQGGDRDYNQGYNQDYGAAYEQPQDNYGYQYYEQPPQKRNTALVATVTAIATALIVGGIAYFGGKYVGETTVEPVTETTTTTELSTTTETTTTTTTQQQSISDAVRDRLTPRQNSEQPTEPSGLESLFQEYAPLPNSNEQR